MKSINKAAEIFAHTIRNVLKRNSLRFAAALLVALASFVAVPNATLAAGPQHHDQVPGFYRLKVGDLEVTALFEWARRIRCELAKRTEDEGWCPKGTARRPASARCRRCRLPRQHWQAADPSRCGIRHLVWWG